MFSNLLKKIHKIVGRKFEENISSKDYLSKEIYQLPPTFALNTYNLNESIKRLEKIPGVLDPIEGLTLLLLSAYGSGTAPAVEVGSYLGRSTSYIALGSKISLKKGVYAIDMFPSVDDWYLGNDGYYHFRGSNYYLPKEIYNERSSFIYKEGGYQNMLELFKEIIQKVGLSDMVIPFKGNSLEFAKSFKSGTKFRMIFIDGDHTYEGVLQDISSLKNFLIDDGVICFHDYCKEFSGVVKAVDEHIISSKDFSDISLTKSLLIARKCKNEI